MGKRICRYILRILSRGMNFENSIKITSRRDLEGGCMASSWRCHVRSNYYRVLIHLSNSHFKKIVQTFSTSFDNNLGQSVISFERGIEFTPKITRHIHARGFGKKIGVF